VWMMGVVGVALAVVGFVLYYSLRVLFYFILFYSNVMGELLVGTFGCDRTDNQTAIAPGLSHAAIVPCHYC